LKRLAIINFSANMQIYGKKCAICGKSSSMGGEYYKLISRYNPSPKKRKYPNLQWVKIPLGTTQKDTKNLQERKFWLAQNALRL